MLQFMGLQRIRHDWATELNWTEAFNYCWCCSVTKSCLTFETPWTAAHQASLSFTTSQSLLKLIPWSQLCHPTISPSVVPISSCPQSFPASGSFLMSQLFASGGQSIRASASASVLPMNIQDWFPLGWTGWISLQSPCRDSQESSTTPQFKNINSSMLSHLYSPTLTFMHDYWKNHSLD